MTPSEPSEDAIFEKALQLPAGVERQTFLDQLGLDNPDLRRQVEELLQYHHEADDHHFLHGAPAPGRAISDEARDEEKPGTMFGRYQLLEKIGEGGFGVVYSAEQKEPIVREVAVKIIKLGMDTREVMSRFEAERQALALMDHPNIAKVLDAGSTQTGRPYFVMERVRGTFINRYCNEERLSVRERLDLFITVCSTIEHAHQKGIIHRDIKPSNVMITMQDGRPAPKVIDFGIAKAIQHRLTERTYFTLNQQFLGTPAYMSPEQASGSGSDIDTRSDIYSLGVLLYEMLTGTTPLDSKQLSDSGYEQLCKSIRELDPVKPSARIGTMRIEARTELARKFKTNPGEFPSLIRGDLDWIVLKALSKEREHRYATATDFAQDIERYIRNEPVSAVAPSPTYLLRKFVRRNKPVLAALAAIILVLVFSASFSLWKAGQATKAQAEADVARTLAERNAALATLERNKARLLSSQSDRLVADELLKQNRTPTALLYLARSLRSDPGNRAAFKRLISALTQRHIALRHAGPGPFDTRGREGHFNADGTRLVVVNEDLTLTFIDTRSGGQVRTQDKLERLDHGVKIRFTHDGTRAVTMEAEGGHFRVWDMETGRLTAPVFRHEPACLHFGITPDDRLIVSSGGDSCIRFWSLGSGAELFAPIALEMPQKTFALAVNGTKLLVSQGYRRVLQTWDIGPDTAPALSPQQLPFSGGTENIFLLDSISPDGATLLVNQRKPAGTTLAGGAPESAAGSPLVHPTISAWDIVTAQFKWENLATEYETVNVTWSTDGSRILVSDLSGKSEIRSGLDGTRIQTLPVDDLTAIRGGKDGQTWIAQDASAGRIFIWDQESGQELVPRIQTEPSVSEVALTSSSRQVNFYASNQTNGLQHLDFDGSRALAYPLSPHTGGRFADICPDWGMSAWIDDEGNLVVTDQASGNPVAPPAKDRIGIAEARFTGDGSKILTLTTDKRSMSFRTLPGLQVLAGFDFTPPGHIGKWAVNRDGSELVFVVDAPGEWDYPGTKQVYVWRPMAEVGPAILDSVQDNYFDAGISPDGTWIFLTLRQGGAILYEKAAEWTRRQLPGTEKFTTGAFSHDDRWLALVSKQSGARIYDLAARLWSPQSLGHTAFGEITQIHFSQDDRQLLVTGLRQPPDRIGDVETRTDRRPPETGLLWDWQNDDIASDRIPLEGSFPRRFSPDGNRFLLVSDSGPKILDLAPALETVPEWLYRFVEGYSGFHFSKAGKVERTPSLPVGSAQQWLDKLIGRETNTPLARWCQWLVADRTQRVVSPESALTLPEHVERLLQHDHPNEITEAWSLAPFDARVLARMASVMFDRTDPTSRTRADWFLDRAFHIDPECRAAWFAEAKFLFNEGRVDEALTAIGKALHGADSRWRYHRLHADLLSRMNEPDQAVAAYDRAIALLMDLKDGRDRLDLDSMRFKKIGLLRQLGRKEEIKFTQDQLYRIPARDALLASNLIDLTDYYNAGLSQNWHSHPDGSLASLRPGLHRLNNIPFDIRGIVQLQCDMMRADPRLGGLTNQYPRRIDGIPIDQPAGRVHFIQAALYGSSVFDPKGTPVVTYVIHYSDGAQHALELKLGEHTRDWWIGKPANSPAFTPEAGLDLAWQAYIPSGNIGLFLTTWINPRPDVAIQSIDLESAMTTAGPFLLAITVE